MAIYFDSLTQKHIDFIRAQKMFFIGSCAGGRNVNISPKGGIPLCILGADMLAYLDLYGSNNRTAEDIAEGSPVTVMFCSFDATPLILRLFCIGEIMKPSDAGFDVLFAHWDGIDITKVRQIFLLKICKVQSSCGYGVPIVLGWYGERKLFAVRLVAYLNSPLPVVAAKIKDMVKKMFYV
ncbi:MAG: pyridoxamine 5'-phosphate oxidase family protein [Gallionella sp.]|nr:pyridoxamine 5'-phosphate oxidase family protein [Gallionella sp.]